MAPGDLLEGEAQRLGVGEAAVGEQREGGAQRGQLVIGELDRFEVEVLRRQRVELGLEEALARLLDPELDPEALELGPVGVEAPREGVVVHVAVALDLALDLQGGNRPALSHQERDQRELADQLLCVLRHGSQDSLLPDSSSRSPRLCPQIAVACRAMDSISSALAGAEERLRKLDPRRTSLLVLLAAMVVSAAYLLYMGRGSTFTTDEWHFIGHFPGWSLDSLRTRTTAT